MNAATYFDLIINVKIDKICDNCFKVNLINHSLQFSKFD